MKKLKFLKDLNFFKFLSQIYVIIEKKYLILNKSLPSGPQVERAPPSSLLQFFLGREQENWRLDFFLQCILKLFSSKYFLIINSPVNSPEAPAGG